MSTVNIFIKQLIMSDIEYSIKRGKNMGMLRTEDRLEQRLIYERSIARFSEAILKDSPDAINIGLAAILDASKSSRIYIFKNFTWNNTFASD